MRGIRIWHLAALALTVPLLAASTPSGCTNVFNPNFLPSLGINAASAGVAAPNGFVVFTVFNRLPNNGSPPRILGTLTYNAVGASGTETAAYSGPLYGDKPTTIVWACNQYLYSLEPTGGTVDVYDPATGTTTSTAITYTGGALGGNQSGDPLECGAVIVGEINMVGTTPTMTVTLPKH